MPREENIVPKVPLGLMSTAYNDSVAMEAVLWGWPF